MQPTPRLLRSRRSSHSSRSLRGWRTSRGWRASRSSGYSLVEILVVLSIIALLASVIGIAVFGHLVKARVDTTRQSALKLRQTVVMYRMDRGDECPTVAALEHAELIDAASKTTDAWDEPFVVTCSERGEVHVASKGPDRKLGTEDDIVAPEPPSKVADVTRR